MHRFSPNVSIHWNCERGFQFAMLASKIEVGIESAKKHRRKARQQGGMQAAGRAFGLPLISSRLHRLYQWRILAGLASALPIWRRRMLLAGVNYAWRFIKGTGGQGGYVQRAENSDND
jgi:hypothetical protein